MAERLFRSIGRADLIDDPKFRTNADRVRNAEELDAIIGAFIAERTQAENVAFFEAAEVTIGPIYDTSQILEDPHFIEREVISDYPDPDMGIAADAPCRAASRWHSGVDPHCRPRGSASTIDPCWPRSGSPMTDTRSWSHRGWCAGDAPKADASAGSE